VLEHILRKFENEVSTVFSYKRDCISLLARME